MAGMLRRATDEQTPASEGFDSFCWGEMASEDGERFEASCRRSPIVSAVFRRYTDEVETAATLCASHVAQYGKDDRLCWQRGAVRLAGFYGN